VKGGASLLETLMAVSIVAVLAAIALHSGIDTLERVRALVGGL
jgi:Tfp pilus assembly protein FimT